MFDVFVVCLACTWHVAEVNDWAPSADADRDAPERDQEVSQIEGNTFIYFNKIYTKNKKDQISVENK